MFFSQTRPFIPPAKARLMIPPHIKNKFSDHPQTIMRPVHLRLSEEIIAHLEVTAKAHGFKAIQGLIRLYIRQGLDRDNSDYSLAKDALFIERLRKKGVSQSIIDEALIDTNSICESEIHTLNSPS